MARQKVKDGRNCQTLKELLRNGVFIWHLRIKTEGSFRAGLNSGSHCPRFDARIKCNKNEPSIYINPITKEIGDVNVGTHIPLE
jgi:hypothetical protein